jgi:hypothetical protein
MALELENYDPARKYGAVAGEADLAVSQGSVIIGDSNGAGTELDASGSGKVLVGNGTTAASVAVSGDATLASNGAVTLADDSISKAKLDYEVVEVTVSTGQTSGTATVTEDAEILGYYPTGNQDQFVDNIAVSTTTLTLTLAAAATADNTYKVTLIKP